MKIKSFVVGIFLLLNINVCIAGCKGCGNNKEVPEQVKFLLQVPKDQATIGVVPYLIQDKQIYILLVRDKLNGKFADLGGDVRLDGSTFAQNALRVLKDSSMGKIAISEPDLLDKSIMVNKPNYFGRKIAYLLYPLNEEQYKASKKFNELRKNLVSLPRTPSVYLEKDKYCWLKLQDIVDHVSELKDIDGNKQEIQLQDSFVQNFIMHAKLQDAIKSLDGKA